MYVKGEKRKKVPDEFFIYWLPERGAKSPIGYLERNHIVGTNQEFDDFYRELQNSPNVLCSSKRLDNQTLEDQIKELKSKN